MKISYKREAKRNYLVVEKDGTIGYEARMLSQNHVRGLLRMYITYEDGRSSYCYDITSRQPLSRLLETRFIEKEEIVLLMVQIHSTLTGLEEYLLNGDGLLLEPEYIYVEPELFQAGFCLIPGEEGIFQQKLSSLLQAFLKRIDHRDRECVVLAYGLYQESLKENCGMEDLMDLVSSERSRRKDMRFDEKGRIEEKEDKNEDQNDSKDKKQSKNKSQREGEKSHQAKDAAAGKNAGKRVLLFWKLSAVWGSVVFLVPAGIWIFFGKSMLINCWRSLIFLDGGLLFVFIVSWVIMFLVQRRWGSFGKRTTEQGDRREEEDTWRIIYDEEEDEPEKREPEKREPEKREIKRNGINKNEYIGQRAERQQMTGGSAGSARSSEPEYFQTVLLSERSQASQEMHRLTALDGSDEDIEISYYPFVIGKHKDLADYVLQNEAVSRLHVRLDRDEDHFTITDLNSTNGTRVQGKLLEANETAGLEIGDSVHIADVGYIFS